MRTPELVIKLIQEAKTKAATFLDLGHCGLTEIPEEILELADTLERLNLSETFRDNELQESFYNHSKNDFGPNNFNEGSAESQLNSQKILSQLPHLKRLGLYTTYFPFHPEGPVLSALEWLDCSNGGIQPDALLLFPKLKFLGYNQVRIGFNPDWWVDLFGRLPEDFEELDLRNNNITEEGIRPLSRFKKLHSLNLGLNYIGEEGLRFLSQHCPQLRNIDVRDCKIGPEGLVHIGNLRELENLEISQNPIGDVGAYFLKSLAPFKKLKVLTLHKTEFTDAGVKEICEIKTLENLVLAENNITAEAAQNLGKKLKNLSWLSFSNCPIGDSGATAISKIQSLKFLFVPNCQISNKGALALSTLGNLEILYISNNQIGDEGVSILVTKLTNLREIGREGFLNTNTERIPLELLRDLKELRQYLKTDYAVKAQDSVYRILLVGNSRAGKSSLTEYLITGRYTKSTVKTHGIKHTIWNPKWNTNLKIHLWDFGGQDYYHGTHGLFIRDNSLFLCLWFSGPEPSSYKPEDSDGDQNLPQNYWLGNVRMYSSNSILWFLQTRSDEPGVERKWLAPSSIEQFKVDECFFISLESDWHSRENWIHFETKLQKYLESEVKKQELLESWIKIRDKYLQAWQKKSWYIKSGSFESKCTKVEPEKEKLQYDGLLIVLEKNGEILRFPKAKGDDLGDYIFIDPVKLTSKIYDELLKKDLRKQNGQITFDDNDIGQKLIKALLLRYKLIFQKPGSDNIFVVPQYLPQNDNSLHFSNLIPLSLKIKFPDFMPRSLFSTFMSTFVAPDPEASYWLNGTLFKWKDGPSGNSIRAYVRFVPEELEIHIHTEDRPEKYLLIKAIWGHCTTSQDPVETKAPEKDPSTGEILEIKKNISFDNLLVATQTSDFMPSKELKEAINSKSMMVKNQLGSYEKIEPIHYHILEEYKTLPKRVFLSYSHKDEKYKEQLDNHLSALKRSGKIETWNDRKIDGGSDWDKTIKENMEKADIFLFLISADFMASEFIWNVEIRHAISSGKTVVPIFLRPCDFKVENYFPGEPEFHKKQGFPRDKSSEMQWITNPSPSWPTIDHAYLNVVEGLKSLLN